MAGKRADGEGTWEQIPSGLWRLIVQQDGKRIKGPARPTKPEARVALAEKLRELSPETRSRKSFGASAEYYLSQAKKGLAPSTAQTYSYWVATLKSDPLAEIPVGKVTTADLAAWAKRSGLAATTRRKRIAFFCQVLKEAGHPIEAPRVKVERGKRRPLTVSEQNAVRQALQSLDPRIALAVRICWMMGLRRSEVSGLRHEDRDGDGVWIQRTVTYADGKLHVRGKTKSDRGYRWVVIPMELSAEIGSGKGFVCGEGNKPLNPRHITERLREIPSLAKVPAMGPHALRRTYGMKLLESGADVVTASELMGHDPGMLLKEYARSRADLMRKAVKLAFDNPLDNPQIAK